MNRLCIALIGICAFSESNSVALKAAAAAVDFAEGKEYIYA